MPLVPAIDSVPSSPAAATVGPVSPRDYVATDRLRDGASLRVRALLPTDRSALTELFGRLSAESIRYRAFTTKIALTEAEVSYLIDVDFVSHVALAAIIVEGRDGAEQEHVVGVGRYCRIDVAGRADALTTRAELAVTVVDEHQGRGIGTLLVEHLAEIARVNGIAFLVAEVMAGNRQMLTVLVDSGFVLKRTLRDAIYEVTFPTTATKRFVEASRGRQVLAEGHRKT